MKIIPRRSRVLVPVASDHMLGTVDDPRAVSSIRFALRRGQLKPADRDIQKAQSDYENTAGQRQDVMCRFAYDVVIVILICHSSSSIGSLYRMASDCFSRSSAVHSEAAMDIE